MNHQIPIVMQYSKEASIRHLGGIAVYPNEYLKSMSKLKVKSEIYSRIEQGVVSLERYDSPLLEGLWTKVQGFLRRLSDTPLFFLAELGYIILVKYLSRVFATKKNYHESFIYHHMNNFVFPNYAVIKMARRNNIILITTIVDLIEEDFPEIFPKSLNLHRKYVKKWISNSTSFFLPITDFVERDSREAGIIKSSQRSKVVKWGVDHLKTEAQDVAVSTTKSDFTFKLNLKQPFYLFPAKSWPNKGHIEFLDAYCANPNANFKVIFLGDIEPIRMKMNSTLANLPLERQKQIDLLGFVDEKSRLELFQKCAGVILPSCYEGFGFPYFEATFLGKPFYSFKTKSYLEFFGDIESQLAFEIGDFAGLVGSIVLMNETVAQVETQRRLKLIQDLTWMSSLEETVEVYESLLDRGFG